MWKALNDIFDKKNEYSLHALIKSIVGIKIKSKFNELWARLIERTVKTNNEDDTDSLEAAFRPLATSLKAKGSLFLTTLPEEIDNVIDNLKTKSNLTYDDICSRLLELSVVSSTNEENQAYLGHQKRKFFKKYSYPECSYCKAAKKWYKGHTVQNCRNKKRSTYNDEENNMHYEEFDSEENVALPANHLTKNNWKWIFDTGATSHMSGNRDAFKVLLPFKSSIRLGNNHVVNVTHIGEVTLKALLPSGRKVTVTLYDVLYSPELKCSLMSWEKIKAKGVRMKGNGIEITLWKNNQIVGWVVSENKQQVFQEYYEQTAHVSVVEWHRRLGHTPVKAFDAIKRAVADPHVLPKVESGSTQCEACIQGKMTRLIPRNEGSCCFKILEKIHSDVAGPFSTKSVGGKSYYVTFIDEYSRYTEVVFISHKNEVESAAKEFILRMERQTGLKVSTFKSDNGGEYTSNSLKDFFKSNGIKIENSIPNVHETNGIAERTNRTLITMARTCLIDAKLPLALWAEAVAYAAYTKNRIPHSFHKYTPYELFFGEKPAISHLRRFGHKAFIYIMTEVRAPGTKFYPRSKEAKLVGYGNKQGWYRFYNGRKVVVSRDYKLINDDEKLVMIENLVESKQTTLTSETSKKNTKKENNIINENGNNEINGESENIVETMTNDENDIVSNAPDSNLQLRRSNRIRKSPQYYYGDCMYLATDEPMSFNDAITGPESQKWTLAIQDELDSMKKNQV